MDFKTADRERSMKRRGKRRGSKTRETETVVVTKKMQTCMHCLRNLSSYVHFLDKNNIGTKL